MLAVNTDYNPNLGRITQEDIYRGDGLNLYAYCQNNPVKYYDPSGYMSFCPDYGLPNSRYTKERYEGQTTVDGVKEMSAEMYTNVMI